MSIAGVFPPICDYKDGHLLIDGCYVNNVPGNVCIFYYFSSYFAYKIYLFSFQLFSFYLCFNTTFIYKPRINYNLIRKQCAFA